MNFFLAVFLGVVQGLTEFLPVSSSGHLAIFQRLIPSLRETPPLFDVLLHLGTLAAVCAAFRGELAGILREVPRLFSRKTKGETPPERRMILLIVLGTLPLALYLLIQRVIDVETAMQNLLVVGLLLMATGLLLYLADRAPKGHKAERNATVSDALMVGVFQAIAVLPGLSRSGTTIAGGLFRRFDRAFAIRFSFLLSLPAVLGANLYELYKALKPAEETFAALSAGACVAGVLASAVVGYLSIGFLKRLADKGRFGGFALYCLAVGVVSAIASFFVK